MNEHPAAGSHADPRGAFCAPLQTAPWERAQQARAETQRIALATEQRIAECLALVAQIDAVFASPLIRRHRAPASEPAATELSVSTDAFR